MCGGKVSYKKVLNVDCFMTVGGYFLHPLEDPQLSFLIKAGAVSGVPDDEDAGVPVVVDPPILRPEEHVRLFPETGGHLKLPRLEDKTNENRLLPARNCCSAEFSRSRDSPSW